MMKEEKSELVDALRTTADRLSGGARYEWGHMGRCNCGHLVQTLTEKTDREIVESIDFEMREWTEHAQERCELTGHKVDALFDTLDEVGFGRDDVIHLENLTDPKVLQRLPDQQRHLRRNQVDHVTLYMNTLADVLEEEEVLS